MDHAKLRGLCFEGTFHRQLSAERGEEKKLGLVVATERDSEAGRGAASAADFIFTAGSLDPHWQRRDAAYLQPRDACHTAAVVAAGRGGLHTELLLINPIIHRPLAASGYARGTCVWGAHACATLRAPAFAHRNRRRRAQPSSARCWHGVGGGRPRKREGARDRGAPPVMTGRAYRRGCAALVRRGREFPTKWLWISACCLRARSTHAS